MAAMTAHNEKVHEEGLKNFYKEEKMFFQEILKFTCLFVSIWLGSVTVVRLWKDIPTGWPNLFWWSLATAGFIYLQWLV